MLSVVLLSAVLLNPLTKPKVLSGCLMLGVLPEVCFKFVILDARHLPSCDPDTPNTADITIGDVSSLIKCYG